jgi:hypothetical protein
MQMLLSAACNFIAAGDASTALMLMLVLILLLAAGAARCVRVHWV